MFEQHIKSFSMCSSCPSLCQSACPVHTDTANKSFAPWGMMQILSEVQKKRMDFSPEVADIAYRCTTCKACSQVCEHHVPISEILEDVRTTAVKRGMAPQEINGFIEKFHRHNNPFSKDLLLQLKDLVPEKVFETESQVVYFASCTAIAKTPDTIRDTFSLFKKLKIDFVGIYTDPVSCCGYPLYSAGAHYDFVDVAEIHFHALKNKKMIIAGSPTCAWTLKNTYAKYDFDLSSKVITVNEFLAPYLKNINFKITSEDTDEILYHDPCYLSRYMKEIEGPRELISQVAGMPPQEFLESREESQCSGQGGCYSIVDKKSADRITERRVAEAHERKIKTIVTQCPSCNFKMKQNSKGLKIFDIVSYLNARLTGAKADE